MTESASESPESGGEPIDPAEDPPAIGKFVPRWALISILVVWAITVFLGTVGLAVPREVSFATRDGQSLDFCSNLEVEAPDSSLCTRDRDVVGLPTSSEVESFVGDPLLDFETIENEFLKTLIQPALWLALGLGGAAVLTLFSVAHATGTFRTGLATSVTLIFFAILLFPGGLTAGLDHDLRSELINAWKVVISFYFGSEAAVQAFKVFYPTGRSVTGDVPDNGTPPATG